MENVHHNLHRMLFCKLLQLVSGTDLLSLLSIHMEHAINAFTLILDDNAKSQITSGFRHHLSGKVRTFTEFVKSRDFSLNLLIKKKFFDIQIYFVHLSVWTIYLILIGTS